MRVALSEPFPILEQLLQKRLANRFFRRAVSLEQAASGETYDLFVSDRSYLPRNVKAKLYLIPGTAPMPRLGTTGQILTGGMNLADHVTLSSIRENRAMLCLQQEIRFAGQWIAPFEKPFYFDRRVSLYKNLAVGFTLALMEIVFGEEEKEWN